MQGKLSFVDFHHLQVCDLLYCPGCHNTKLLASYDRTLDCSSHTGVDEDEALSRIEEGLAVVPLHFTPELARRYVLVHQSESAVLEPLCGTFCNFDNWKVSYTKFVGLVDIVHVLSITPVQCGEIQLRISKLVMTGQNTAGSSITIKGMAPSSIQCFHQHTCIAESSILSSDCSVCNNQ